MEKQSDEGSDDNCDAINDCSDHGRIIQT
jgi:hypothetical protein